MITPALSFFLNTILAIQDILYFHTNFKTFDSSSVKNTLDSLIDIALILYVAFGSMVILTMLILPIQKHGISFHPCCFQFYSLVSYSFLSIGLLPL